MTIHYHNGHNSKECTDCHRVMVFGTFFTVMAIMVMNSHGVPLVLSLYSLL